MQDTLKFLKTVWPENGLYCIALPYPNGGYEHKLFETIEAAASYALSLEDRDVFFAVGTLIERKVWNPEKINKKTGEKGVWEVRCAANTLAHKTLIIDVDCGEDKPYASQIDALQALKNFCVAVGMPAPIINSSGGGLHCYWPFKVEIKSSDWQRIGEKFKRICKHYKFYVDMTASADRARVLRVPGTYNCKKTEKRISKTIKWTDKFGDPKKIEAKFDAIIEAEGISLPKVKVDSEALKLFEGIVTLDQQRCDKDLDLIYERCQQMQRCRREGGTVGYAMRGNALSVIKFTRQKDYSPLYVDPNPELVASQNDAMLLDSITDNPHTCEKFEETYPEGCNGCKHKGKVKSPISLGILATETVKSVEESAKEDPLAFKTETNPLFTPTVLSEPWKSGTPRYAIPKGYALSNDTIVKQPTKDDDNNLFPTVICPGVFYPYGLIEADGGEMTACCYGRIGNSIHKEVKIPLRLFASPSEMSSELAARGMILTSKQTGEMVKYMSSYVQNITNALKSTEQHNQLGWKTTAEKKPGVHTESDPEKFVLPYCTISKAGVVVSEASKKLASVSDIFGECGTLDEWKQVINVYGRQGYEGYAFGTLSALGSPLMQFTEYAGAIISMIGDSAAGKSTVLRAINSFWGKPDSFLTQSDTQNAFMSMIGTYGSIAITADELTDLPPERVSALCYAISQGREKHAMTADRTMKENEGNWKLLLVSSSNRSLLTKLAEFKKESAAEAYRVFEFSLDTSMHRLSKSEAEAIFPKLLKNYGHAGKIYIEYVVNNLDRVKSMIAAMREEIDRCAETQQAERYWTIAVCLNLVGGQIAKELGLIDYDIEALKIWAIKQIREMRGTTTENTRGTIGTLSAYLSETIGNTITMGGQGNKSKPFFCIKEPSQRVWNRYETENGLIYVDRSQLRTFIVQGGGDYHKVLQELQNDKIVVNRNKLTVLTKGSNVSSSGQSPCVVINAAHPAMQGEVSVLKVVDNAKTV